MNEGDKLLEDILDHPHDDTPRLIYADWLTDNGQPNFGEFIHLQCQINQREPAYFLSWQNWDSCGLKSAVHDVRRCAELLPEIWREQIHPINRELMDHRNPEGWVFIRGFLHSVKVTIKEWEIISGQLMSRHPIERVFTDRVPVKQRIVMNETYFHNVHCFTWSCYHNHGAANMLYEINSGIMMDMADVVAKHGGCIETKQGIAMDGRFHFETEKSAHDALSETLINRGRHDARRFREVAK